MYITDRQILLKFGDTFTRRYLGFQIYSHIELDEAWFTYVVYPTNIPHIRQS
jgi:hypothetical protein